MKIGTKHALYWSLAALLIGLITPSVIILCLAVFVGGISPMTAISDIIDRQFSEGNNLYLIALFGLIPFGIFSIMCFGSFNQFSPSRLTCVAIGGLIGILALMIPAHISVWYPLYSHRHASSTGVIAFFFIPFYCIVTLYIGIFVGWLISLLPFFRNDSNKVV
jgi:hypothetical protein